MMIQANLYIIFVIFLSCRKNDLNKNYTESKKKKIYVVLRKDLCYFVICLLSE